MDSLVSVAWLTQHLPQRDVVVLDATLPPVGVLPVVDTAARYREEHIPGALFFDIEALSDHSTPLPHMLPQPEVFGAAMAALGVGSGMRIVVYEQTGIFSAPRAWWMLRTFGAKQVAVLDGGLGAWKAEGQKTEAGEVTRPPATFEAVLNAQAVRRFADVQAAVAQHGQIVDARSAVRFAGTAPEPRAGLRSGHVPGAVNVPFAAVGENGYWKSTEALQQLFREQSLDLNRPVITTCGSGVTAAVLSLALERSGARDVGLYDGSWAEYAQEAGAVIEKSGV